MPAVRKGPPIKRLSQRPIPAGFKAVQRVERTYSYNKKLEVLLFLDKHRVPFQPSETSGRPRQDAPSTKDGERAPTFKEASEWFKIPYQTIQLVEEAGPDSSEGGL